MFSSRQQTLSCTCKPHCTVANPTRLRRQHHTCVLQSLQQPAASLESRRSGSHSHRSARELACRPLWHAAQQQRQRLSCNATAFEDGEAQSTGITTKFDDDELTALDGFEEELVDEDDEDADVDEVELENWTQKVKNWWDFGADEENLLAGTAEVDAESVPWNSLSEKNFFLGKNLAQIRERNPDFVGLLPIPERDQFAPTEPPPVPEPAFANPDWDEWEYRAYVEKYGRLRRERDEWNRRRAAIGEHRGMVVDDRVDLRLQMKWDKPEPDWTHEQIFNLITLDGTAAMPADIAVKVQDPLGRADMQELGGKYLESTEEYLRRIGHLMERPPTQEDLVDLGVTQLAGDFEGFEQEQAEDVAGAAAETSQQLEVAKPQPPPKQQRLTSSTTYHDPIFEEGWE